VNGHSCEDAEDDSDGPSAKPGSAGSAQQGTPKPQ
jgi:hypothetical protein